MKEGERRNERRKMGERQERKDNEKGRRKHT